MTVKQQFETPWPRPIEIKLVAREDGGLRVYSDEVPGLILSGSDPQKIMAAILPALHGLKVWR